MIIFSGKMHFQFTLLLWLLLICKGNLFFNPIPMLIASVFPDCDHKRAIMGRILPMWLFCKHRGFTHSIHALVLFTIPVLVYNIEWGVTFAFGYLLHLLMDSSTPAGVNWWMTKRKDYLRR